jgi:rhodanese-related sulfurtransferase
MDRRTWVITSLAGTGMLMAQSHRSEQPEKKLSADELKELLDNKDTFFLDVREPKELEELGTIKGYINIPLSQIESRLSEIPKNKLIITA